MTIQEWRIRVVLIVVIILATSCIYKFTPDLDGFNPSQLIVVEGQITDKVGPFRVKITTTYEINNLQRYAPPMYGAEVIIFDDQGNQFQLFHTLDGWYETEDKQLKGVVGNTYTLSITTENGVQYESSPVVMPDIPEISNLYWEVEEYLSFEGESPTMEKRLDIFVDAKDVDGGTEYWKWDFEETWDVRTPKDSVPIKNIYGEFLFFADVEFVWGNQHKGWDNNKERCWVEIPSREILIQSTNENHNNEIIKFSVKSIAENEDRLHIRYSILVRQTALSKKMYRFWERLKEVNEESGNMYDKVPSQVFGNIHCCDGDQEALGYFTASAEKTKRIYIDDLIPSVFKTKDAYDRCGFTLPTRGTNIYLGHIVSVSDTNYTSNIGIRAVSQEPWCPDCRMYGWNEMPDFWEE